MSSVQTTTTKKVTKTTTTESCASPEITITRKGGFFNDSFFEDRRKDYQSAIRDVLFRYGDQSPPATDEISIYRDLRNRDLKDETQAVKSSQDDRFHKIVLDVQDFTPGGDVTVKTIDDKKVLIEGLAEKKVGNSSSTKTFNKSFIFSDADMDNITSVISSDGILTVTIPKKQQQQQITNVESNKLTQNLSNKNLCISEKGDFFNDSFFADSRKPFEQAVQDVLRRSNELATQSDHFGTYRNLRQRDLKEETQAVTTSDDSKEHKIIMDVHDFIKGGDVVVKTVDDREVVVEGNVKTQDGNKTSTKSFKKKFVLPDDIQPEYVTSVVSRDGILTITAPKKNPAIQSGVYNVPLSIQ